MTHEPQQARPPCPSPTPGVYSNSCPLCWWCHPTTLSSVVPFSSCPQSFPASGSFQMSQLFASGGQSIGVSASTSVLPVNTQDWSPLGWTGWIFYVVVILLKVGYWSIQLLLFNCVYLFPLLSVFASCVFSSVIWWSLYNFYVFFLMDWYFCHYKISLYLWPFFVSKSILSDFNIALHTQLSLVILFCLFLYHFWNLFMWS